MIVAILASIAEILPIIFYLVFLKRNRGEGLWVIFLYCVFSILTEVLYGITKSHIIFSCFGIVQFALLSLFAYFSLRQKRLKYIPIVGAVIFYVVAIGNFTNRKFDSLSASLAAVLLIPYCILLLYEEITNPRIDIIYNNKKFWVIIAILIYFSATLFLYLYYSTLSPEQQSMYWSINNISEILKNILFSVAFIMKKHYKNPYAVDSLES